MASSTQPPPSPCRTIGQKHATLSRALEKAQIAVERDRAGNVRGALASYRSARELLSRARRRTTSHVDALKLDAIATTYDTRIRDLREAINNEPREDDENDYSEDTSSSRSCEPRTASRPRATPPAASTATILGVRTTGTRSKPTNPTAPIASKLNPPAYPPRKSSHQQQPWHLTPEREIKATVERYMKRKLPERPASATSTTTPTTTRPRYVKHFDDYLNDDESIEVLIDWWNDLLEGGNRWSMSSDRTLVASPAAYGPMENRKSNQSCFSSQRNRNGVESPTDSVRFWSPPATPMEGGFEDHRKTLVGDPQNLTTRKASR